MRTRRVLGLLLGACCALATLTGVQVVTAGPASAGQLGLTIEIQGAAKVTVIEGSVADDGPTVCDFRDNLDDRVVNVCPRIRSEAVFAASVWLRIEPLVSETDDWRAGNWSNGQCDEVRQVQGTQYDCRITSASFSSTERTIRAVAYDATPPVLTSFTSRRSTEADLTGVYEFSSTQGTFECSADRAVSFFPCTSGFSHTWPAPGNHVMLVRGVDTSGNTTGVQRREDLFLDTYIRSAPPAESASRTASFTVGSPGATELRCSLDGAEYSVCSTSEAPFELTGLANGPHELRVYGAHPASRDEVPAVHRWTVGVFPETWIEGVSLLDRTAQFLFSSSGGTSYTCRLTGQEVHFDWLGCQSPVTLSDLPDGDYTFEVRAHDAGGAADPTPASHSFTVVGRVDPDPDPDPDPVDPAPLPRAATVVEVVDADTLVLRSGAATWRADLAGLTAPKAPTAPRCAVRAARAALAKAAKPGRTVRLVAGPRSRTTGTSTWTVLAGSTDLGLQQLRRGYARYDRGEAPASRRAAYAAAQRQAQRAHRGVWGAC